MVICAFAWTHTRAWFWIIALLKLYDWMNKCFKEGPNNCSLHCKCSLFPSYFIDKRTARSRRWSLIPEIESTKGAWSPHFPWKAMAMRRSKRGGRLGLLWQFFVKARMTREGMQSILCRDTLPVNYALWRNVCGTNLLNIHFEQSFKMNVLYPFRPLARQHYGIALLNEGKCFPNLHSSHLWRSAIVGFLFWSITVDVRRTPFADA